MTTEQDKTALLQPLDSQVAGGDVGGTPATAPPGTADEQSHYDAHLRDRPWRRRTVIAAIVLVLVGVGLYSGVPWLVSYFHHVSTDDAYVSGYVTYVGARIASRVEQVAVDEDDFIHAGEVLVRLDTQPFRLVVEQAKADLRLAEADLAQARAEIRSQLSAARANQYLTQTAIDQLRLQVASLQSAVANLKLDQARLVLAERNFGRTAELLPTGAATQQDYDRDFAALNVARDTVASQVEKVQQVRAGLGLPRNTENPTEVPPDIEQSNPQVQTALSNWATSMFQIGVPLSVAGLSPEALREQVAKWMESQTSQKAVDAIVENAPAVQVAIAKVNQAQAALDTAQLNLSYTEIKAPFDGFVTKRTVNPGDYATVGQNLLAVQSLRDVWVDANFKETALKDLRIGMPVDVYVDAYPGKVFSGRVAGFSPATGARLSLLPPENATGNFVKVVQRLPVRIEFDEPSPTDTPLFVGLSVQPQVRFKAPPRGAHAGERLRLPKAGGPEATGQPAAKPAEREGGPR